MRQKRIMILGGNIVQAEATLAARRQGYYTVSTDLHTDNPGHAVADEYCPVDITDREAVLREASRIGIDGIVPYTSDVLAPVAAYVAETMGLPGNPCAAVDVMTHKDRFRDFLRSHGFPTPRGKGFRDIGDATAYFRTLGGAAMMKPVDSAGSKGVFKVCREDDIVRHWQETMAYSAEKTVIIEDFIEREGLQQDGDIFVANGRIVFWGVGDQHKDPIAPYVPAMLSFPSTMRPAHTERARELVQQILSALGFRQGPCNVEYVVSTSGEVYIMEIGPRNGGNLIPFALQECTGVDLTALTVRQAVGDSVEIPAWDYACCALAVVLHARRDGVFRGVEIAEKYRPSLCRTFLFRREGDAVSRFHNGGDTVGTMTFRFDSREEMEAFMADGEAVKVLC